MQVHPYNPSVEEAETGRVPGARWLAGLACLASSRLRTLSLKANWVVPKERSMSLTSCFHTCTSVHIVTNSRARICTCTSKQMQASTHTQEHTLKGIYFRTLYFDCTWSNRVEETYTNLSCWNFKATVPATEGAVSYLWSQDRSHSIPATV